MKLVSIEMELFKFEFILNSVLFQKKLKTMRRRKKQKNAQKWMKTKKLSPSKCTTITRCTDVTSHHQFPKLSEITRTS